MKIILNGIFKENPMFVLVLGLCPALAITTKFESAYLMGLCLLIILMFSNVVIAIIKRIVPDAVRIPVYILIISTFVTIIEIILKTYIPALSDILGIYLPLITVNCIVLGRAMAVASKESIKTSLLDAIGIGLGYTFALMIIAFFREALGAGTITFMDATSSLTGYKAIYELPTTNILPISILTNPAGAYIALAFFVALFSKFKGGKKHESH
ncbi:MAG: electron transport complex subunit RsxE [Bacilli bacterium]|nr:electron transport complex subunit RsxE [Bacilli bacterium]MDD4808491.1 electron transport complex subunit RsxE [Bacilli bacterium]